MWAVASTRPSRPSRASSTQRADASKCDPKLADRDELTQWLRNAISAGYVGELWDGDFPRYAWIRRRGVIYEARLVNPELGQIGYQQAQGVRRQLAPDYKVPLPIDRYVTARTRRSPDSSLQAIGAGAGHPSSVVIVGQSRPRPAASTRFTLSRALWHRIWDDSPVFVITSARTRRQQIERAFAAELLAPAQSVAELLESPPEAASQEELEQIAQHYGVSSMVVEHQVRNQLIGMVA